MKKYTILTTAVFALLLLIALTPNLYAAAGNLLAQWNVYTPSEYDTYGGAYTGGGSGYTPSFGTTIDSSLYDTGGGASGGGTATGSDVPAYNVPANSSKVDLDLTDGDVYLITGTGRWDRSLLRNAKNDRNTKKITNRTTNEEVGAIVTTHYGYVYTDKITALTNIPTAAPAETTTGTPTDTGTPGTTTGTPDAGTSSDTGADTTLPKVPLCPENEQTRIVLEPTAGLVLDSETLEVIDIAVYDDKNNKIYYVETGGLFGEMVDQVYGYICATKKSDASAAGGKDEIKISGSFTDIPAGQYYTTQVQEAREKGWVPATDTFKPGDIMTRCDFATAVVKAMKPPLLTKYTAKFSDVPKSNAAAPYVYTGLDLGFWKGQQDGSGTFGCKKSLLRAEVAVIFTKVLGLTEEEKTYKPADTTPDWALSYIRKARKAGVMMGLGKTGKKFGATLSLNRADAVTALHKAMASKNIVD